MLFTNVVTQLIGKDKYKVECTINPEVLKTSLDIATFQQIDGVMDKLTTRIVDDIYEDIKDRIINSESFKDEVVKSSIQTVLRNEYR